MGACDGGCDGEGDGDGGVPVPSTLVMSTGVIGVPLPISKILSAIRSQRSSSTPTPSQSPTPSLANDFPAWERAAKAFMTTDTFPKLRTRAFTLPGHFTLSRSEGEGEGDGEGESERRYPTRA